MGTGAGRRNCRLSLRKISVGNAGRDGFEKCYDMINNRIEEYREKLVYWREHYTDDNYQWARFIGMYFEKEKE